MSLENFIAGYMECALWSSSDGEYESLDSFSFEDIAPSCLNQIQKDCGGFYEANQALWTNALGYDDAYAGNDFWLTRNGHGAGFWNRGELKENRYTLNYRAAQYQVISLYIGDDGLIYAE